MIESPTPPHPITAAFSPGRTPAVLTTAPTPVVTAHPRSAPMSKGSSFGTATAADSGTTMRLVKAPRPRYGQISLPLWSRNAVLPLGSVFASAVVPVQSHPRPATQLVHRRHGANHERTTWSPGARLSTCVPTAATTPDASWPRTSGCSVAQSPSRTCRSEWHTPAARMSTEISPGPGAATLMCSMAAPAPRTTKASCEGITVVFPLGTQRSAGPAVRYRCSVRDDVMRHKPRLVAPLLTGMPAGETAYSRPDPSFLTRRVMWAHLNWQLGGGSNATCFSGRVQAAAHQAADKE